MNLNDTSATLPMLKRMNTIQSKEKIEVNDKNRRQTLLLPRNTLTQAVRQYTKTEQSLNKEQQSTLSEDSMSFVESVMPKKPNLHARLSILSDKKLYNKVKK